MLLNRKFIIPFTRFCLIWQNSTFDILKKSWSYNLGLKHPAKNTFRTSLIQFSFKIPQSSNDSRSENHEVIPTVQENFINRHKNENESGAASEMEYKTNQEIQREYSVFSIDPGLPSYQSTLSETIKKILNDNLQVLSFRNSASSRKPLLSRDSPIGMDHDDNKYKRRVPGEIFSRWSR